MGIGYVRLPFFCSSCKVIGHSLDNWKKNSRAHDTAVHVKSDMAATEKKKIVAQYVPKQKEAGTSIIDVNRDETFNIENETTIPPQGVISGAKNLQEDRIPNDNDAIHGCDADHEHVQ